ncbi:twin-arginine translocase TatA/TatE family subunit [Azospirillum sp. SYSU D00513]|uniref:twin-arginine translocase TatA/TatE family subunit n=1 Tax=Azospirillum sp. SYSU D00513 TaxID=2812561 RepID=UPI001A972654|nr:twin-arginine translocase TatA/TatE family subunit [Azospirillum sp. SYSU D00513]
MGFTSIWHWVIVLVIVVLFFGAGKLPKVMGDVAKGVKSFKAGLRDDDETDGAAKPLSSQPAPGVAADQAIKRDEPART